MQIIENTEDSIDKKMHYLPHHAVFRHDRHTTKVRVVYDASARSSGPSLNDCLYTGPKFNQKIPDILLRFRTHRVALTADIEKAFLVISKTEMSSVSCGLRMFHRNNPSFLFMRVVFGVSSSPFLLNTTIKHHVESFTSSHPKLVKDLCCVVLCLCLFVCLFLSTCHFEIHYLSIHLIIIAVTKSL